MVVNLGKNPFLLAPDSGANGPFVALVTLFKEAFPGCGVALAQGLQIVLDLEQGAAFFAMINDRVERIGRSALRIDALEPGSIWHQGSLRSKIESLKSKVSGEGAHLSFWKGRIGDYVERADAIDRYARRFLDTAKLRHPECSKIGRGA